MRQFEVNEHGVVVNPETLLIAIDPKCPYKAMIEVAYAYFPEIQSWIGALNWQLPTQGGVSGVSESHEGRYSHPEGAIVGQLNMAIGIMEKIINNPHESESEKKIARTLTAKIKEYYKTFHEYQMTLF